MFSPGIFSKPLFLEVVNKLNMCYSPKCATYCSTKSDDESHEESRDEQQQEKTFVSRVTIIGDSSCARSVPI